MINIKYRARAWNLFAALLIFTTPVFAKTYTVPTTGHSIIGNTEYTTAAAGETLVSIGKRFDIGLNGMADANPGIDPAAALPAGAPIQIPSSFLLPPIAHQGIVINLAEMRLYYFPAKSNGIVKTYPIGIGRVGKTIPLTRTAVIRKAKNPVWIPPADIIAFNQEQGIKLPTVMRPGPDNPLGPYAIYLRIPTYLIHSTIFPDSVGRRASFGCIRMHESDIVDFFPLITAGVPVTIINMPSKIGWQGQQLFLETHVPLEEHSQEFYARFDGIIHDIDMATRNTPTFVDWQLVAYLGEQRDGMPHEIGFKLHP
jgi:L,D-transpeptidase ErfK/SrfK